MSTPFPEMISLQYCDAAVPTRDPLSALEGALNQAIEACGAIAGSTVGLAIGSRGIDRLAELVAIVVGRIEREGGDVRLIPAMGSHGAADADGQAAVVERLTGQPRERIASSMETDIVGQYASGQSVFAGRVARCVDHLLVINRIKPHTMFTGAVESGLSKMLTVGLGKAVGAAAFHAASREGRFEECLRTASTMLADVYPFRGGFALIEDSVGELAEVSFVAKNAIWDREAELLERARKLMPTLPFDDYVLLIIDEIGKDISGSGMDMVVVGRKRPREEWRGQIFVGGLSEKTAGNGYGIGNAEWTNQRTVDRLDFAAMDANTAASGNPSACYLPQVASDDQAAIRSAIGNLGANAKVIHIRNTKNLRVVKVSRAYEARLREQSRFAPIGDWEQMRFDGDRLVAVNEEPPRSK